MVNSTTLLAQFHHNDQRNLNSTQLIRVLHIINHNHIFIASAWKIRCPSKEHLYLIN